MSMEEFGKSRAGLCLLLSQEVKFEAAALLWIPRLVISHNNHCFEHSIVDSISISSPRMSLSLGRMEFSASMQSLLA